MPTTIGQILVNETLPEKFRDYSRTLGADELEGLLKEIIKNDPSVYKEVSAKLMRLGAKAAFDTGTTLRLSDLEPPFDNRELYARLDAAEDTIRRNPKLTDEQKEDQIADLYDKVYSSTKQEAYNVASAKGNGFAMQVKSKARGNQDQLSAMINTPGIYSAPSGKVIPLFIRHSFAEGLTPAEYWAGSYGARSAIMCLALDTEVLMGDWSVRKIIDIKPGDTVMGSNANGQMYPVSVLRVYDNGVQPVYRFSFRVGSSRNNFIHVDATEEHKMLAILCNFGGSRRDGTCKPDSLSAPALVRLAEATPHPKRLEHSKYVAQLALEAYTPMGGVHNEFALLLGLIAGDGCCSPTSHGSITLSCADPELISDISDYLHTLGITLKKSKGRNYNWVLVRSDDCPITWHTTSDGRKFNNRTRAAVWEVYGGCLSHTKDIPEGIWSWDNESILAYLSGIIATDGSVYQAKSRKSYGFSFAVNSLKLLLGVKNLLERRFGIFCGAVHEMQRKRVHHMYGITIDHPKAAEKFFRLFENLVPGVKKHTLRQAHGVVGRRSRDIGCRVAKKEFLGNLPVMDIEVGSPDHMFVLANGLVSSNSTKFATAKAGALGKLFSSSAIEQVVTEDDCGTIAGMPVKADDKDNIGSVLAQDVGDFKAGTVITKQVMADLKKANIEDILVRSPVTCNAKRGVCSHCAGIRENGKFPEIGYNLGLNSASALAERIAQGGLNAKHSGRVIKGAKGTYSGFEMLKRMATIPGHYADKATVSEIDGRVERIEKAPQGGSYVWVNDEKHYVPSGYDILVKPGDEVEAGDQLSDGVISPADAVRLKGIGEGRRYFTQRFTQAYRDSGYKGNRRNVESIARALINNVVVDTEDSEGQMLPGDEVTYSRWAWGFKPRQGSVQSTPRQAVGKYLEQPALHYTIGTRVTKKVVDELEKFKVPSVLYNEAPPGVHPEMRSIVETTGQTDDWMGRLGTTYIGKRLVEDVQQGAESNSQGLNPYPAVAKGTTLGQWGTPGHKNEPFHY